MAERNLDDTLRLATAKVPKVVNEPSSDSSDWSWDWNKNADEIIAALGWKGLAQACAWYDPDGAEEKEDGYPKNKNAYYLPHHKLIDGKLTLVWGGVRAAMQRLKQTKGIDQKAAYEHLAAHYRHFGKEPPPFEADAEEEIENKKAEVAEKKKALAEKLGLHQELAELSDNEKLQILLNFIDYEILALYDYFFQALESNDSASNFTSGLRDVLNTIGDKIAELYSKIYDEGGTSAMANKDTQTVDVEALERRIAELEEQKKELEAQLKDAQAKVAELEAVKAEYEEFKAEVEAEREEARKKELAATRFAELEKAGLKFSDERREKVLARLREMTDEEFEDYKADLLEIASVKAVDEPADESEIVVKTNIDRAEARTAFAGLNVEKPVNQDLVKKFLEMDE